MNGIAQLSPWDLSGQKAMAERLSKSGDPKEQLRAAAQGFESILIRKWIEVARSSSLEPKEGMMGSYQTLADDQLAAMISRQGGVGLVEPMLKQMMRQIENRIEPHQLTNTPKSAPANAGAAQLTSSAQKSVSNP